MGAVIALDQSLIPTFVKYRADNIQTLSKSLTSNSDMKQDVLNRLQEVLVISHSHSHSYSYFYSFSYSYSFFFISIGYYLFFSYC